MKTREELEKERDLFNLAEKEEFLNNEQPFIDYLEDTFINRSGKLFIKFSSNNTLVAPWNKQKSITRYNLDRCLQLYDKYGSLNITIETGTWHRDITLT